MSRSALSALAALALFLAVGWFAAPTAHAQANPNPGVGVQRVLPLFSRVLLLAKRKRERLQDLRPGGTWLAKWQGVYK
jgi:hypothetical protein